MSENIPRIAAYDRREIFRWPVENDFIEDPFEYIDSLHTTKQKCNLCNSILKTDKTHTDVWGMEPHFNYVLICPTCGFWAGRKFVHGGFAPDRDIGIVGRVREKPLTSENIATSDLLRHFSKHQNSLTKMNPKRAESFVMDILSDWFCCDVIKVGGSKDGGVDGILFLENSEPTIVQVKWRKDTKKAESISVVRELAGTMLVQGVPKGYLVTTRTHVSPQTQDEIGKINSREVDGLGVLNIGYSTYNNLIDMISLSSRYISENPKIDFPDLDPDDPDSLFSLDQENVNDLIISENDLKYIKQTEEDQDIYNQINNNIFWNSVLTNS